MTAAPIPLPGPRSSAPPRRVAMLSVHTSPLEQPGTGDAGGLNVYVAEVSARLARLGVEVDVFTRATSPDARPVTTPDGVVVHPIVAGPTEPVPKSDLPTHLCAFVLALSRHPRAGLHDVVHAHYWLSGWVGRRVARRWGSPLVQTFHTLGRMKNRHLAAGDTPEPPLRLAAERRIAADADRIAVLTCEEAALLHREFGVSGARVAVVPAGVDTDRFRPGPVGDLDPAVPERGPMLLFVGRLQPLKGPDVAVDALAEVRDRHPDAHLVIVGGTSGADGDRTAPDALLQRARGHGVDGAVTVLPPQPQDRLVHLYRRADVVVVPSRSETFGLVALEAQACGTPVVATRVGGLRAVVADGGVLVDGHDPRRHAAAITDLLDHPVRAAAMGVAGRRHACSRSWEVTAHRLVRVYGDVAAPARARDAG